MNRFKRFLVFCAFVLIGAKHSVATSGPDCNMPRDRTREFSEIKADFDQNTEKSQERIERILQNLKNYQVIFTRGILSTSTFRRYASWLSSCSVENHVAETETEGPPQQNIQTLHSEIQASSKPVILISHSRGSQDVLATLLQHKEYWLGESKVKAWLAVQSSFLGSPVADKLLRNEKIRPIAEWRLQNMGGWKGGLESISVRGASEYYKVHKEEIRNLVSSPYLKILTFGSWIDGPRETSNLLDKTLEMRLLNVDPGKWRNDGFVPLFSTKLAVGECGADYVQEKGIQHWDITGTPSDRPISEPYAIMNSFIYLLLPHL